MSDSLGTFGDAAKTLSRNPLGIVALFIVLVYAMAALVLGVASPHLWWFERVLLVLFLVLFPFIVLSVFRELVIEHTGKLYSPADIADLKAARAAMELWKSQPRSLRDAVQQAPQADPARLFAAARLAAVAAGSVRRVPQILWVDDRPENNAHERRALEAAGYAVATAPTTADALARARGGGFDAIISDMGRPEGEQAGYDLLEALRAAGIATPFIIFSGSGAAEHRAEALARGATESTNDPAILLQTMARILSA